MDLGLFAVDLVIKAVTQSRSLASLCIRPLLGKWQELLKRLFVQVCVHGTSVGWRGGLAHSGGLGLGEAGLLASAPAMASHTWVLDS